MNDQHADEPDLHHYSCLHAAPAIQARGALLSLRQLSTPIDRMRLRTLDRAAAMASQLVWLTTLDNVTPATARSCGLTSTISTCDRTEFRFKVLSTPAAVIEPWTQVRERWPNVIVRELEAADGVEPETWYVSAGPIAVVLSPRTVTV